LKLNPFAKGPAGARSTATQNKKKQKKRTKKEKNAVKHVTPYVIPIAMIRCAQGGSGGIKTKNTNLVKHAERTS